jgi:SAM-dependent methyltransferase
LTVPDARLVEHYEQKYAAEAGATGVAVVGAGGWMPRDRHEAAIRYLLPEIGPGARVLELGAGSGVIAASLAAAGAPFHRYLLTDLSTARLAGLRRTLRDKRFGFAPADADAGEGLDGLGGPFDVIVMVALIEHLIDPIAALGRMHALLAPEGVLYVDTPNVAKWTRRLKLACGRFPSTASVDEGLRTYDGASTDLYDEGHLHYFTFRSLERVLLERVGFSRCRRCPYTTARGSLAAGVEAVLARPWPGLFSEIACLARA